MPRKATLSEVIAISDLLRQHAHTNPDGTCSYKNGWTDEKIAQAIDPTLSEQSVARVRKEMFGPLIRTQVVETGVDQELREAFLDLSVRFNHLCKAISIARGGAVDASHLAVNIEALRDRINKG